MMNTDHHVQLKINRPSMTYNKRTAGLPLICLVCGDVARGINFELMTCISCKAFFRRHAGKPAHLLRCQLDDNCEITLRTRGACSACRLRKCLLLGMNPRLIRESIEVFTRTCCTRDSQANKNLLPQPKPLSLLQQDRSTLTSDEWALLSNIIHAYDASNIIPQTKTLLQQQLALPPKMRSKLSSAFQMIKALYSTMQPFVERSAYFHHLSIDGRVTLIHHNSHTAGAVNCILLMRELDALNNAGFVAASHAIYGPTILVYMNRFVNQLEQNGTLVKVMFLILAFASNCSVVVCNQSEDMNALSSSIALAQVQDILVTMLWKYLLYLFGFAGAVQRYSLMIKLVLDILGSNNDQMSGEHSKMIDTLVEETTHSLAIADGSLSHAAMA